MKKNIKINWNSWSRLFLHTNEIWCSALHLIVHQIFFFNYQFEWKKNVSLLLECNNRIQNVVFIWYFCANLIVVKHFDWVHSLELFIFLGVVRFWFFCKRKGCRTFIIVVIVEILLGNPGKKLLVAHLKWKEVQRNVKKDYVATFVM